MHTPTTVRTSLALALALSATAASAKPEFLGLFTEEYPAVVGTRLESCSVCHTNPPRRNPYGTDYNLAGRQFSSIEPLDSDDDGADNLSEIMNLTFPGDAGDGPLSTPVATATQPPTHTPIPMPTDTATVAGTPTPTHTRKATPTIVPGPCHGDCDGNGSVGINELIVAVRIALGNGTTEECALADSNGDGEVGINELIQAVGRALRGCPSN